MVNDVMERKPAIATETGYSRYSNETSMSTRQCSWKQSQYVAIERALKLFCVLDPHASSRAEVSPPEQRSQPIEMISAKRRWTERILDTYNVPTICDHRIPDEKEVIQISEKCRKA